MSAVRVARGYTGRNKIVKFMGCYHGHSDAMLVKAGLGVMTSGIPDSAGVPSGCTRIRSLQIIMIWKAQRHCSRSLAKRLQQ